jgi:hypothetical protein
MTTPAAPEPAPEVSATPPLADPTQSDKFILRQKLKLVINQYFFYLPDEDGDEDRNRPVAFVEQKRFKFKEDIRFYTDESKTTELMRIQARQRFDPRAKYDITNARGERIGLIQKAFGKSLARSTYNIFDGDDKLLFIARERSLMVALFRRLVGFIPYVGDFSDWLPIAYHFDFFRDESASELVGSNERKWGFRDIYRLDLTPDTGRTIDRRLVLALVVGQDALQAR